MLDFLSTGMVFVMGAFFLIALAPLLLRMAHTFFYYMDEDSPYEEKTPEVPSSIT